MTVPAVLLLACVVTVAPLAAESDEPVQPARALVEAFVDDIQTFTASFDQSLLDADGTLLENSSGELVIRRPGQFRWAYVEPYEQRLIADGLNIWSYDVDLAQVTVKPQVEALANTPALLLGGSVSAIDEFVIDEAASEAADETGGLTWVRMRPVDAEAGFRHVDLGFAGDVLERMVFRDNLEQTTLVFFSDVVVDEPVDAGIFEFVVPDDVDVVGTPAVADSS